MDPSQQPQPSNPPSAPQPQPGAKPDSWFSKTFTRDELKAHPSIGKFKSVDDFGASYVALEKKLGDSNRIALPGAETSDADRAEFFKKLGWPEKADDYTIFGKVKELLPENSPVNEPFINGAREAFHKLNLTDAQSTGIVTFFAEQQAQAIQQDFQQIEAGVAEVKKEWGHAYDERLAVAGRAIDQLTDGEHAIPGLAELMDPEKGDPHFGSNPVLIRLFYWLGTLMGEDKLVEGQQRNEQQVGDLTTKKAELMKRGGPYWDANHADHKAYVQQVSDINKQLAGGQAA